MRRWFAAIALLLAAPALASTQPQDISQPGFVPHAGARAGFPEQVGELRRMHVVRYEENNLSANYDLRRGSDVGHRSALSRRRAHLDRRGAGPA
jgi:hypothetical protein